MEMNEVTKKEKKEIVLSVRVTKEIYKFIKANKINPSKLFEEAIKEIKEKK